MFKHKEIFFTNLYGPIHSFPIFKLTALKRKRSILKVFLEQFLIFGMTEIKNALSRTKSKIRTSTINHKPIKYK